MDLIVEEIFRNSRPALLAGLARIANSDLALAEDALSEAFLAALRGWPEDGIPAEPTAWIGRVAKNKLIDQFRSNSRRDLGPISEEQAAPDSQGDEEIRTLELLFVCAHPAIDAATRAPLMMQTVLGLDAARIASLFLASPSAMGQRLVRAKSKIRDAAIPFEIPRRENWPERVRFVLEAIYATYTATSDNYYQEKPAALEALWLARLVASVLPAEPEARGLAALLLFRESRRAAMRNESGHFIPLNEQDPSLWDRSLEEEASSHLDAAFSLPGTARFSWEAAIQAAHASRRQTGKIPWPAIVTLYSELTRHTPALGVRIAMSIAVAETSGPGAGLDILDQLNTSLLASHQPYWAARAHLLAKDRRISEALACYDLAIKLTPDPSIADFLKGRADRLRPEMPEESKSADAPTPGEGV